MIVKARATGNKGNPEVDTKVKQIVIAIVLFSFLYTTWVRECAVDRRLKKRRWGINKQTISIKVYKLKSII